MEPFRRAWPSAIFPLLLVAFCNGCQEVGEEGPGTTSTAIADQPNSDPANNQGELPVYREGDFPKSGWFYSGEEVGDGIRSEASISSLQASPRVVLRFARDPGSQVAAFVEWNVHEAACPVSEQIRIDVDGYRTTQAFRRLDKPERCLLEIEGGNLLWIATGGARTLQLEVGSASGDRLQAAFDVRGLEPENLSFPVIK